MTKQHLDDNPVRRAVLDISKSFIVEAPAGSGKTELLTQRALCCLAAVNRPEEVLIMTFTNKAVNEARQRILAAIESAASDTPPDEPHKQITWQLARKVRLRDEQKDWQLSLNPARLRVVTFDSLNANLAAQLPVLSGFGAHMRIEENATHLYQQAVYNLFDELGDDALDPNTANAMRDLLQFAENRVEEIEPMLVELLATRDQWLEQLHQHDALDMEHVLQQLIASRLQQAWQLLGESTGNALAHAIHLSHTQEHQAMNLPATWPEPNAEHLGVWRQLLGLLLTRSKTGFTGLRKTVDKRSGFDKENPATPVLKALLKDLHARDDAGALIAALCDVAHLPEPHYPVRLNEFRLAISAILERLVAHLRVVFTSLGTVDFIEVAMRAHDALSDDDYVQDALLKMDCTVSHLLLDEVQDISVSQFRLLQRLTSGWLPDEPRSLFLVGDPKQSIYSFRQAEVRLFLAIWREKQFNGIALETVCLTSNFRSDTALIDWLNPVFSQIFPAKADEATSAVTYTPSSATQTHTTSAGVQLHLTAAARNGQQQAEMIVSLIHQIMETEQSPDIAVLVRSRSHAYDIIPALKAAGIRYAAQDIDPLLRKSAVSDVINLIRALWHPMDRGAWFALLRAPFIGLAWADCLALTQGRLSEPVSTLIRDNNRLACLSDEGQQRLQRLTDALDAIAATPRIHHDLRRKCEALWNTLGGPACISKAEAADIRKLLLTLSRHCEAGQLQDLDAFLAAIAKMHATPENGTVQILTVHKAKGLEFDHVICPALEKQSGQDSAPLLYHRYMPAGYLMAPHPGRRALLDSPEFRLYHYMKRIAKQAREHETLRLLYVALTRARKTLHLLGSVARNRDGGPRKATSGSFLNLLWPAIQIAVPAPEDATSPAETAPGFIPVTAPRLPADWRYPPVQILFTPREYAAILPSEHAASDKHLPSRNWRQTDNDATVQRIIGTLYHALMERIGNEGSDKWSPEHILTQRSALMAGARRYGIPEPHVDVAIDTVMELAATTLRSTTGQWILEAHPDAQNELELAGFLNGRWINAVIDRAFLDNGWLWIIDYKTAGSDIESQNAAAFIEQEKDKYRPQMQQYMILMEQMYPQTPVRSGLYFPAFDQLVAL